MFLSPDRYDRSTAILAVNDIYRLKGVGAEETGGLHRLATLRARLEQEYAELLLLHAGDFLAPSLLSRRYKGEQMIDVMNLLDGDAEAYDQRLFVTLGNHEFDHTTCGDSPKPLLARLGQSDFTWLTANLDFSECRGLAEFPNQEQVAEGVVVESGGIKVGIFGLALTPDPGDTAKYPVVRDTTDEAVRMIRSLKAQGAEFVVGLTHLPYERDLRLLEETRDLGLDLIVGGHDHDHMALPEESPRLFKADSDARTAWMIFVRLAEDGTRSVDGHLITLNHAVEPEPAVTALADGWLERHDRAFCGGLEPAQPAGCLADVFGRTNTLLEAEELANRSRETGFGDWLADRVRDATGADVALINAGGLRLNYNLGPGSPVTRRQIEELIEYDDLLVTVEVDRETLRAAVDHGLRAAGSGGWPHLGGLRVTRSDDGGLDEMTLEARASEADGSGQVSVASVPFTLCGGDGYDFGQRQAGEDRDACIARLRRTERLRLSSDGGATCRDRVASAVTGVPAGTLTLKALVVAELCTAGEAGISPETDGRIGG